MVCLSFMEIMNGFWWYVGEDAGRENKGGTQYANQNKIDYH